MYKKQNWKHTPQQKSAPTIEGFGLTPAGSALIFARGSGSRASRAGACASARARGPRWRSLSRDSHGAAAAVGSQTEGALLVLLRDWAGQDFQKVRSGESGSDLHSLFFSSTLPSTSPVLRR
jgi:hypothetical protein